MPCNFDRHDNQETETRSDESLDKLNYPMSITCIHNALTRNIDHSKSDNQNTGVNCAEISNPVHFEKTGGTGTQTTIENGLYVTRSMQHHRRSWSDSDSFKIENEQIKNTKRKRCQSEGSNTSPQKSYKALSEQDPGNASIANIREEDSSNFTENKDEQGVFHANETDKLLNDDLKKALPSSKATGVESLVDDLENTCNKELLCDKTNEKLETNYANLLSDKYDRLKDCCTICTNNYSEVHQKIDDLTHDYQMYNKRVTDLGVSVSSRKAIEDKFQNVKLVTILWNFVQVIVVSAVCCILLLTRTYACEVFHEELRLNVTDKLAKLNSQYGTMTQMVQDITKTKPVIKVTGGNKFSFSGNKYYVSWTDDPNSGQGNIRLSRTGDSIVATTGGYYLITCNLFYMFTNTKSQVGLEYDILQKVDTSHTSVVQSAFVQFRANPGPMRQNVGTHSVVYLFPGDAIQVGLEPSQKDLMAKFENAHSLSMFLVG